MVVICVVVRFVVNLPVNLQVVEGIGMVGDVEDVVDMTDMIEGIDMMEEEVIDMVGLIVEVVIDFHAVDQWIQKRNASIAMAMGTGLGIVQERRMKVNAIPVVRVVISSVIVPSVRRSAKVEAVVEVVLVLATLVVDPLARINPKSDLARAQARAPLNVVVAVAVTVAVTVAVAVAVAVLVLERAMVMRHPVVLLI